VYGPRLFLSTFVYNLLFTVILPLDFRHAVCITYAVEKQSSYMNEESKMEAVMLVFLI
jgi:hypothetical protein